MRRSFRLDWRALALLGALLSIILEWPILSYAMPAMILPQTAATTRYAADLLHERKAVAAAAAMIKEENEAAQSSVNYADSADMGDTLMYQRHNGNNSESTTGEDDHQQKSEGGSNQNGSSGNENSEGEGKGDDYDNNAKRAWSWRPSWPPLSRASSSNNSDNDNLSNAYTQASEGYTTPVSVASSEEQLHNSQRIKISNLISNKRKRKKPSDESGEDGAAAAEVEAASFKISKHSISNKPNNNNLSNNESSGRTLVDTTTASNTNEQQASATTPVEYSSYGSPTAEATPTTTAPPATATATTTTLTLSPVSIAATAATLPPSAAPIIANDHLSFTFSSAHHIAILSRTERSINAHTDDNTATHSGVSSSSGTGAGAASGSGVGIVRRSSAVGGLKTRRLNNSRNTHNSNKHISNLDRNERSTISHLSGPSRKVQLYIKNRFIQLLPDGTVNGTQDDQSEYTILQRSTVDVGRIKIQSVATCLYLCMDQCGTAYGSKDFTDDCVFNENMEQHNYNTYSSTYNSNARRTYYLALNRHGEPRKLQIPPTRSLGKLSTYTNAITETVPQERVEQLIAKNFGENRIKHGIRQLCDTGKPLIELIDSKNFKARPKCNPNSSSSSNSSSNKSSNTNSNSSSSSSSSSGSHNVDISSSDQLLNNVPAANDKIRVSSNINNSSSIGNSSSVDTNSGSSSSISSSQNSNGHNSSNSSITVSHQGATKKKKKRRKCRPHENEEEHDCQRGPQALRKKGNQNNNNKNNNNRQKCKEQQQKQQANGGEVVPCGPKRGGGPKKNSGPNNKKLHNGTRANNGHNSKNKLATDQGVGANNRRGKKIKGSGRQPGNNGHKNGGANASKRRGKQNGNKRPNGKQKKQQTTTTTAATPAAANTTATAATTKATKAIAVDAGSAAHPTTTAYSSIDLRAESTSDRGEREQRNVHFSNSMEESGENSAEDFATSDEESDDDEEADESDNSYEDDDALEASSSHAPFAGDTQTQLTGGVDDFLYYDQLDL